jgi:YD repeat-containing protein
LAAFPGAFRDTPQFVTYHQYDALDRRVRTTHPDNTFTTTSYAGGGVAFDTVRTTDELGRATVTHKDGQGRVVQIERFIGGASNRMRMKYDALDRLIEVTDEPGNRWSATCDSLSRRRTVSDPDHGTWGFEYDAGGRLVRQVDANGADSRFAYDGIARMIRREHYLAGATVPGQTYDYKYDFADADKCPDGVGYWNGGKLCATIGTSRYGTSGTAATSTAHNYDGNGLKAQDIWRLAGQTYWQRQDFEAGGHLVAKSWSDGDAVGSAAAVASGWQYDTGGRLASIPGHVTAFEYNGRGQVVRAAYANGVVTANTYNNARGWLTRVLTAKGSTVLQDIAFTRDAAGRITALTSAGRPADSWTYTYDDLDQLLTATNTGNPALSNTYTYDAAFNMTSNSQIGAYAYPGQGALAVRPNAALSAGPYALNYDAAVI